MPRRVLLVFAFLLWLLPTPVRAVEATMTFTGALDVLGLLSSISVQPAAVTVPAGGEVAFVNATTAMLTVSVGGTSTRVEPGGSASMRFPGGNRVETFAASATSVKLPVVGALTSSVGRVTVRPAFSVRAAPAESATPPSAAPRPSSGAPGAPGASTSTSTSETPEPGDAEPLEPSTEESPESSRMAATAGTSESPDDSAASDDETPNGGHAAPAPHRADPKAGPEADVEPVLPPFPGFSSTHDQLGLVFLLGAVVLTGLGTVLFRTVLAFRPVVEVGAHSQAARKARKARRRRS
ncbi:hypothetical protein [Cryptosporangium sp. NPDC048952]|uniref:hypothetical protein n=1 Tax=Cryptosporangium sp. NPDC048952 TaxID=3363961 RepID=UPI00371751EF